MDESYIVDESVDGGGLLAVIMDEAYIIDESVDGGGLLVVIIDDSYIIVDCSRASVLVPVERERSVGTTIVLSATMALALITLRSSSTWTSAGRWEVLVRLCLAQD